MRQSRIPFFKKSSQRDAWQVVANGGGAGTVLLLLLFTRDHHLYIAYLGAVAAATADTLGTEIGTLSRTSPVLITTFRPAQTGRSGGVSLLGIVAGIMGALSIWVSVLS